MQLNRFNSSVRAILGTALLVVAIAVLTGGASAAPTQLVDCTVIDDSGVYVLQGDLDNDGYGVCVDIRTSDVVIDGNGYTLNNTNTGATRNGIRVSGQYDGGTNITIQNIKLTNWNQAMTFGSDPEVTVSNVHADGVKTGINSDGTVDISDSSFVNLTSVGISAPQDSDTTIRNVTIVSDDDGVSVGGTLILEDSTITAGSIDTGVSISDVSDYASTFDATIRNNTIQAGYRVLSIRTGVNATVVDNILIGDGDADGLVFDYGDTSSGDGPVSALVKNNNISDVGDGVVIGVDNRTQSLADVRVASNTIEKASVGVKINEDENSATQTWIADAELSYDISDNTIENVPRGVSVWGTNGTITSNTIRNASIYAISAENASVSIWENTIYNVSTAFASGGAVELTRTSGDVTDNTIDSKIGIESTESSVKIGGNNITSILYGIEYTDSTGSITNNTINGQLYIQGQQAGDPTEQVIKDNVINVEESRFGISIIYNVRAQIHNNTITADRNGIRAYHITGANITGNTVTIAASEFEDEDASGILVRDSVSLSRTDTVEPIRILANQVDGEIGIQIGHRNDKEIHPNRTVTVLANNVSATDIAFRNRNETTIEFGLNYYGPRGPTDHEFVGPVSQIEPFLTTPASDLGADVNAYRDLQTFGYALDLEAGRTYAVGTPARLNDTLSETFGEFDGAVYLYDEASQSWTLATGDEVLGPMDAVVVVPETNVRAVVDFADATPARPTERQVTDGWNFVAPRHYDGAESAFSTQTAPLTDLLDVHTHPAGQPNTPGADFGSHYSFQDESTEFGRDYNLQLTSTGPRVSPFAGYFVYASENGTIPGTVPTGVTYENAVQLLNEQGS